MTALDKYRNWVTWVTEQHKGQFRKYTGEPYINHPIRVANLVEDCYGTIFDDGKLLIAKCVAVGHDVLEDVPGLTVPLLEQALINCGFEHDNDDEIDDIIWGIRALTNFFTVKSYPSLTRDDRLRWNVVQLNNMSLADFDHWIQTVKYADIYDNCRNIVELDPAFAKTYIPEKLYVMDKLDRGHPDFREVVITMLNEKMKLLLN